ncbi:MAG: LysR family transcriptional regulator [Pseudomonadota bacterium]
MNSFHTVARLGGINAAAEHQGMAKSGVSRHIVQLEEHFDVKLLERGARSVRLTPIGERLDQRIASILAEVDLLTDIASEERTGVKGKVTIAATPEFGSFVAARLFPEIRRRHPDLSVAMRTGYAFEDMQDPSTDLAFRIISAKDDRLIARPMGAFRFWIVSSLDVQRSFPVDQPNDLVNVPCLSFREDRTNATWKLFRGDELSTIEVTGKAAVRDFSALMQLAEASQGYAFLPEFLVRPSIDRGTLVRSLPLHTSRPIPVFLSYRPGARRVARIDAVINLAETLVPDLLEPLR